MLGIFICINYYKVISRFLVFFTVVLLLVGFRIEGCFYIYKRLRGWDGVGVG